MIKTKPVTSHTSKPVIEALVAAPASTGAVTKRSFLQLVTRQGVHPDRAKQLLGLTK